MLGSHGWVIMSNYPKGGSPVYVSMEGPPPEWTWKLFKAIRYRDRAEAASFLAGLDGGVAKRAAVACFNEMVALAP